MREWNVKSSQLVRVHLNLVLLHHAAKCSDFRYPGHSLQFVFQEPVLQAAQLAEIVLTGAIHQCVEVDPTHTGGIRPQLRPGIGRQSGRHLRQVFQYPRTRPVSIGILIKNDIDIGVAKKRVAAYGDRTRY